MKIFRISFISVVLLSACNSTPSAKNFSGNWQPINIFQESTREIPLIKQHYFEPLPIDGTLKNMLERWSRESKVRLDYTHPSDFTLHRPASTVRQPNLEAALQELNDIYAPQKISINLESGKIVVKAKIEAVLPTFKSADTQEPAPENLKKTPKAPIPTVVNVFNLPTINGLDETIKPTNAITK